MLRSTPCSSARASVLLLDRVAATLRTFKRARARPACPPGAGVLVLDRVNGVAYVDVSERADHQLAEEWVQRLGYGKLVAFRCARGRLGPFPTPLASPLPRNGGRGAECVVRSLSLQCAGWWPGAQPGGAPLALFSESGAERLERQHAARARRLRRLLGRASRWRVSDGACCGGGREPSCAAALERGVLAWALRAFLRRSTDLRGKSVYHTNVMMAIGTGVAIVCAESVADAKERQHLLSSLSK